MPFDWLGLGSIFGETVGSAMQAGVNWKIAKEQMDFQERMSNTAHQREIKDLRLAGLNPILSAKYGGASTPPGAAAYIDNPLEGITSSAVALRTQREQQKSLEKERERTDALIRTEEEKQKDFRDIRFQRGWQNSLTRWQEELTRMQIANALKEGLRIESSTAFQNAQTTRQLMENEILRPVLEGSKTEKAIEESFEGRFWRHLRRWPGFGFIMDNSAKDVIRGGK